MTDKTPRAPDADPAPVTSMPDRGATRRRTLATLVGLTTLSDAVRAQMGGGHGGHPQQDAAHAPDKTPAAPSPPAREPSPPRDLVAAFAKRLKDGHPDLVIGAAQQPAFADFLASLSEVGQHNERRLQRILWLSTASVSASAPLTAYIASEVDEGDERQQALQDLKLNNGRLQAVLDERQRTLLSNLFVATRSELQPLRGG